MVTMSIQGGHPRITKHADMENCFFHLNDLLLDGKKTALKGSMPTSTRIARRHLNVTWARGLRECVRANGV